MYKEMLNNYLSKQQQLHWHIHVILLFGFHWLWSPALVTAHVYELLGCVVFKVYMLYALASIAIYM